MKNLLFDLDLVLNSNPEVLESFVGLPIEDVTFDSAEDNLMASFNVIQDEKSHVFVFSKENFGKVYKYFKNEKLGIALAAAILGAKED